MAKKKQLAGKKTKLAKLPLTQILANQTRGVDSAGEPANTPLAFRQLPLSQPEVKWEAGNSLVEAYLDLINELTILRSQLSSADDVAPLHHSSHVSPEVLPPSVILQALLQARQNLTDLRGLLSYS